MTQKACRMNSVVVKLKAELTHPGQPAANLDPSDVSSQQILSRSMKHLSNCQCCGQDGSAHMGAAVMLAIVIVKRVGGVAIQQGCNGRKRLRACSQDRSAIHSARIIEGFRYDPRGLLGCSYQCHP